MSRTYAYGGPKLPRTILDQVEGGRVSKDRKEQSRKQRRQAERSQKKQQKSQARPSSKRPQPANTEDDNRHYARSVVKSDVPLKDAKPTKSILKKRRPVSDSDADNREDEADAHEIDRRAEEIEDNESDVDDQEDVSFIPRSARSRLEEDDAEIARLERKLGIKDSSKTVKDDELDWLVNGSDSGGEDGSLPKRKRSEDDDEWLRAKRRKAKLEMPHAIYEEEDEIDSDEDVEFSDEGDIDAADGFEQAVDDEDDGFEGFSDHEEITPVLKKVRENPYVAPVTENTSAVKYVPPSLRQPAAIGDEETRHLRRQLQGLLNRLSEANILSILQSVEDVYSSNARQYVTSTLIELLSTRIADKSTLNDTFLILHAGFATAVYRVVGVDFIAQLVENLVKVYDVAESRREDNADAKEMLNLLAFLSDLYVFQAIGSEIIFDHIRLLLDNFTEANTEILLRVIRTCGTQLRQDDPSALKDIVLLLQRSIAKVGGEANVSVRTRFMVETIIDLKNNRMKNGTGASAVTAEHVRGMKRTLGSLTSSNRHVKSTEPLRIGLQDLRDTEKKGKWWLVGASWKDPAKMAVNHGSQVKQFERTAPQTIVEDGGDASNSEAEDLVDLLALARAHGMNTDVRRAIFFALLDSVSYQHAHERILKLNLKNKQTLEIPRVISRCAAAEQEYNHFYTLVALQFCSEHRLRKAWEFGLLDLWRRMGEDNEGADELADEEEAGGLNVREIYNLAKLYASLIAEGLLRITILKTLDFASATGLQVKTKIFVQVLIVSVMQVLYKKRGKSSKDQSFKEAVVATFQHAHRVSGLAAGLQIFLTKDFSREEVSALVKGEKERARIRKGLGHAMSILEKPTISERAAASADDDSHSDGDADV